MHEVLRFWLRRGVDGFRVDVLWHLIKDAEYRDNPPNPDFRPGDPPHHSQIPLYTTDRPEVQDVVLGLRKVVDEFKDRVLIGEIYLPVERLVAYYGTNLDGVHLPFNFQLLQTRWNARGLASLIDQYEGLLPPGCWPNWVLGNHDNPRIASRVGIDQARVAAMLLLTLRGTPTLYYGDEIGMVNVPIPADRVRDPFEKNVPGIGVGRDRARTPMQWTAAPGAGFTTGEPWLPLSDDYQTVNVEAESPDPMSLLTLYRKLLRLRAAHEALSIGTYEPVVMTGDLLAYVRRSASEAFFVALNMGPQPFALTLSSVRLKGETVLSTFVDEANESSSDTISLRPNEGVVVMLAP
jgi:alpha-glucosidase